MIVTIIQYVRMCRYTNCSYFLLLTTITSYKVAAVVIGFIDIEPHRDYRGKGAVPDTKL